MMKVTYKQATAFEFQSALQKLANTVTDGKSAYNIKKVYACFKESRAVIAEEFKSEVMAKFAKKNEKGEWSADTFECAEGQDEAYKAAQDSFGDKTINVPRPKLTMHDIRDAKLTALEQMALDPILDDTQEEQKPANVMKLGSVG